MKRISLILYCLIISLVMYGATFSVPSKPISGYNSVEEILRTIDPNILPHFPNQEFNGGANLDGDYIEVLTQKATEIRNYIALRYSEDLDNLSDREIIVLALGIVPFESRENSPGYLSNEQIFNCFLDALGTVGTIYGLVQSFISLWNNGASVGSLLSTAKQIFRLGSGWFIAAYGVYKFGGCVGWW